MPLDGFRFEDTLLRKYAVEARNELLPLTFLIQLFVGRHGVAGFSQCVDDHVEGDMIVVERHDRRVGIHVGLDGRDVLDRFDGHTGPLRGAPSNDSGCGEFVGHEFGECPRGEKLG